MPITDGKMSVRNQTVSTQSEPNHRTIRFHLKKWRLSLKRVWGPWRQPWTVVGEQEAPVHHDHNPLLARRNQRLLLEDTLDRTFPFPNTLPLSLSGRTGPSHAKNRLLRHEHNPSIDHAVNTARKPRVSHTHTQLSSDNRQDYLCRFT